MGILENGMSPFGWKLCALSRICGNGICAPYVPIYILYVPHTEREQEMRTENRILPDSKRRHTSYTHEMGEKEKFVAEEKAAAAEWSLECVLVLRLTL